MNGPRRYPGGVVGAPGDRIPVLTIDGGGSLVQGVQDGERMVERTGKSGGVERPGKECGGDLGDPQHQRRMAAAQESGMVDAEPAEPLPDLIVMNMCAWATDGVKGNATMSVEELLWWAFHSVLTYRFSHVYSLWLRLRDPLLLIFTIIGIIQRSLSMAST